MTPGHRRKSPRSRDTGISNTTLCPETCGCGSRRPFVHRFTTANNHYVFDVNTGRIVRVDGLTWDILPDYQALSTEEIVQKHAHRFHRPETQAACDALAAAQKDSTLFLPVQQKDPVFPTMDTVLQGLLHETSWIVLHITEDCNCKCRYCIYEDRRSSWGKRSGRKMAWDVARLAVDEYLDHSDTRHNRQQKGGIGFYGGEPLMHFPLIKRCVQYVRQRAQGQEPPFHVFTNGTLLAGEIADFLAAERFWICVSLDGPQPVHDYCRVFRHGGGTWDVITSNIRTFLTRHPEYTTNGQLGVNAVLTPFANLPEIDEYFGGSDFPAALRLAVDPVLETDSELFDCVSGTDRGLPNAEGLYEIFLRNLATGAINEDPRNPQWRFQRAYYDRRFSSLHNRGIAPLGETLAGPMGPTGLCVPGAASPHVTVDGDYYPCERFPLRDEFAIGNVWEGRDPARILRIMTQFYTWTSAQCGGCWCGRSCNIGCYVHCTEAGTLNTAVRPARCERYRRSMNQRLVDYCSILERNSHAFDYMSRQDRP